MKKINFPSGGQPVNLSDIKDLHDEFIDIFEALGAGIGTCVVSGVVVSGVADAASISEGWVFLDGEFLKFNTLTSVDFVANPTQYIVAGGVIESRPKNFTTGGLKNTRTSRNAVLQATLPSSGNFIVIKSTGHNQSLSEVLGRRVLPVGSILETDDVSLFDATTGLGSGSWQGWALCDGRNGTQPIAGRSVVCYNPADADYNLIGRVGGQKTVTLTINQIPSHDHSNGGFDRLLQVTGTGTVSSVDNSAFEPNIVTSGRIQPIGGGQPHENRPPYIVLAYVKKIT